MSRRWLLPFLLSLALLSVAPAAHSRALLQEQPSPNQAQQPEQDQSIGGELAQETREAAGEEEHGNLKHSSAVQYLARITGLSVHQAHLLSTFFNFALIAFLIYWFARKSVPAALRKRSEMIQKALEEARAASQEANRRLAEVENRLRKLDVEIGQMQASAEKEGEAEETRIQKGAEEELSKVLQSAEQEIAAAAKQARRELTAHTADLAVALASKQFSIDAATDQALLRNFAGQLTGNGGKDRK
jgi:F-type H+-transporting ATPase subunit b